MTAWRRFRITKTRYRKKSISKHPCVRVSTSYRNHQMQTRRVTMKLFHSKFAHLSPTKPSLMEFRPQSIRNCKPQEAQQQAVLPSCKVISTTLCTTRSSWKRGQRIRANPTLAHQAQPTTWSLLNSRMTLISSFCLTLQKLKRLRKLTWRLRSSRNSRAWRTSQTSSLAMGKTQIQLNTKRASKKLSTTARCLRSWRSLILGIVKSYRCCGIGNLIS